MQSITDKTTQQIDALVDSHLRAEEAGDIRAIVNGFATDAEHDVAGRAGGPLHGGEQIAAFYQELLAELHIDRFEPVRRWYGENHVADESILHATAKGRPFGLEGHGRPVHARILHIFDFDDGLITRESAWLDLATLQQQLADPMPAAGRRVAQQSGLRWMFANLAEIKLSQDTTMGQLSVVELSGPPGDMPPLHVHQTDDEAWYVLEGEMSFFVGADEPIRATAGSFAFGPKGVPHTYRVESGQTARWLAICTPGDFANFVLAASRPAERPELPPPHDPPTEHELAAITSLALEHGIQLLGPPGALPTDIQSGSRH